MRLITYSPSLEVTIADPACGTGGDIEDIVTRFDNLDAEKARERTEQSFLVPKREIADNGYDLFINKYKKTIAQAQEYPSTREIMKELLETEERISAGLKGLEAMLNAE